jgi:hypothetical protein
VGGEEGSKGREDTASVTSIDELGSDVQPTETAGGILWEERIGADRLSICEGKEHGAGKRGSTATRWTEPEARVSGAREAALGAEVGTAVR